jgi:ABC-type nickel/cobalt efflux system permease component RcnA
MISVLHDLIVLQREIYLAFAARIGAFAETGDWSLLAAYLPMGVAFGAVHALTPGHSKAVLATYLTGSTSSVPSALATALILSTVHVGISVVIALLSLPLVSVAFGEVGRAPLLENFSRCLLGAIGLLMVWQGIRGERSHHGEDAAAGFFAGLIPCPLTLFVMTFAISRGVPSAGVAFAIVMMLGVALVLGSVATAAVLFRKQLQRFLASRPKLFDRVTRTIQVVAGLILATVAMNVIVQW